MNYDLLLRPYAAWTRHSSAQGCAYSVSQQQIVIHVSDVMNADLSQVQQCKKV